MVYLRHRSLPVAASSAAIQSRAPPSPPEAPMTILSRMGSGAPVMVIRSASDTLVSHTTWPEFLSVAMMRAGPLDGEMTRFPHNAAPRLAACRLCLGSMSQFCGSLSGLSSRSGVTSAAKAGDATMLAASRAFRIDQLCLVMISSHLQIRASSRHELQANSILQDQSAFPTIVTP